MRILVISDTHGNEKNLKTVLKREGKLDYVLHLGDIERGEERIAQLVVLWTLWRGTAISFPKCRA